MVATFFSNLEFITSMSHLQDKFKLEVNVKKAFDTFDTNKDGKITADELKKILGSSPDFQDKGEEYWNELIKSADHNGDGEVSTCSNHLRLTTKNLLHTLLARSNHSYLLPKLNLS